MLTRRLATALVITLASIALAKPDRPVERKPDTKKLVPVKVPDISFRCQFGIIVQSGFEKRTVVIEQGGNWSAVGRVRADGQLQVLWTSASGTEAHGVYRLIGDNLVGSFVYTTSGEVDASGRITGDATTETLWRMPEPEPDFM